MSTQLSTEVAATEIDRLARWWWQCWCGMNWGFRRHAVVYWACSGEVPAHEARDVLGVDVDYPLDVVIFYRELVETLLPEHDLAKRIVNATPPRERTHISRFYGGNSVFEQGTSSTRAIYRLIDEVTVPAGMPKMRLTDDGPSSRIATARMVFDGLRRTYVMRGDDPPKTRGEHPMLLVSSECPELVSALPSLESDPKNQEDIRELGTMQDCVWSACCNTYRDYPSVVGQKPMEVLRMEAINRSSDPTQRRINLLKFNEEYGSLNTRPRKR